MKLLVKNIFSSISGKSKVTDETGAVRFIVKGKLFSNTITKTYKKIVKDANNKKLFVVKNKFWHSPFHYSAIIYNDKKQKIAIVKTSHLIANGFEVVGATKPITVEGTGWNLDIKLGNQLIGHISPPAQLSMGDSYSLEVFDEADAPFLVAMMIAIDNIHDRRRK